MVDDEHGRLSDDGERDTRDWVELAARAAWSKTDEEVTVLDVGNVLNITDYFVICSGRNTRQVKTLADEIEAQLAAAGGPRPRSVEGLDSMRWVLMDFGGFVVHVFLDEAREYYELERLWTDVPRLDWQGDEPVGRGAAG